MQFPYPIIRLLRINNADGSVAVQIGPGPQAVFTGTTGAQFIIDANGGGAGIPTLFFWNANHDNAAYINLFGTGSDANLGLNSGGFPSIRYPTMTQCQITEVMATASRSAVLGPHRQDVTTVYYGGRLDVSETIGILQLLSDTAVEVARVGVRDLNTTGVARPITENTVGGSGVFVDATTVQTKATINEPTPIQWTTTRRWLEVSGFDWSNLGLLNGWSAAATYYTPGAKMTPDGMIMLCGTINAGTVTDNTQIATVPTNAWVPSASVLLNPASSNGGAGARLLVNTTGQIFCYGMVAGTQLGLDGLQFRCVRPT